MSDFQQILYFIQINLIEFHYFEMPLIEFCWNSAWLWIWEKLLIHNQIFLIYWVVK